MRKILATFDEVAICVSILALVYFWVGLVIVNLSSVINPM
jgi:hypothetical protein